jgi:site-specific DNA-methyltransferase (adenine-specific)
MADAAAVGEHGVDKVVRRHSWLFSSRFNSPNKTIHVEAADTKGTLVLGAGEDGMNRIVLGNNLNVLQHMKTGSIELIYVDPPFNTGKRQSRTQMKTIRDEAGDRVGFGGRRYRTEVLAKQAGGSGYGDQFDDFLGFLRPRMVEAHRLLSPTGSLFFHIDYREVHYCKVMLDEIFGRECFQNEIIWAYDYGARATKRWPAKHDNILWYTKHPTHYTFHLNASDRIPYMAPGLVGAEKAARGKTPTDVWWHTIVSPTGKEKTGYATQKPLGVLERIVRVHSNPGETVLDFFAGSGTTGEAAAKHGRHFVMVDESAVAVKVMEKRLKPYNPRREDSPEDAPLSREAEA